MLTRTASGSVSVLALIQERRLFIRLRFPRPPATGKDTGVEWDSGFHPGSTVDTDDRRCANLPPHRFNRGWAKWCWTGKAKLEEQRIPIIFC